MTAPAIRNVSFTTALVKALLLTRSWYSSGPVTSSTS